MGNLKKGSSVITDKQLLSAEPASKGAVSTAGLGWARPEVGSILRMEDALTLSETFQCYPHNPSLLRLLSLPKRGVLGTEKITPLECSQRVHKGVFVLLSVTSCSFPLSTETILSHWTHAYRGVQGNGEVAEVSPSHPLSHGGI